MTVLQRTATINPRVAPSNENAGLNVTLRPKRWSVTFDATWSPYMQGSMVAALLSQQDLLNADPRSGTQLKVTGQRLDGQSGTVLQSLALVTFLRSRSMDYVSMETTLGFAGPESLLQDYVATADSSRSAATDDVTIANATAKTVTDVFAGTALGVTLTASAPSAGTINVAAANSTWAAGTSAWDYLNGLEESAGRSIRGNETGTALIIGNATDAPDNYTGSLSGTTDITAISDVVDRANPDWANFAAIRYNGASPAVIDVASQQYGSGARKTLFVERTTKQGATGGATSRASRASKRGRVLQVTAIANLSARPNQQWSVTFRGITWTVKIQAVTFRFPEGLMDMTLNVVE